jgi:hypothetical protein
MPVNAMHPGPMAILQLDSHKAHQLLLVRREGYNVLSAHSFACNNVGHTKNVESLSWALGVVNCHNCRGVLAAAKCETQLHISVRSSVYL